MIFAALLSAAAVFTPESAFREALSASAEWKMERTLPGASRVLRCEGSVVCTPGTGIVWRTERPFEASVTMGVDRMIFEDEDGRREKKLSELPHYEDLRRATDAFAAGGTDAFDGVFAVARAELPGGGWRVTLTPGVSQLGRLVKTVEITGAALPTNVVFLAGDGSVSRISFREKPRDR